MSLRSCAALLGFAGLLVTCARPAPLLVPRGSVVSPPPAAGASSARPASSRVSTAEGAGQVPPDAAAEAAVAQALDYVSRIRELEARGAVKGRTVSRDEMVSRVEHGLDTEIPPAVVRASGEILFALGTVPASFDYRLGLLQVMRSELLGFYEPHEKTMFLGADLQGQELSATLWHELVHALQDQHYGLDKLLDWADDAGDWQAAVHALAEGDATSAMIDALFADKHVHAFELPDQVLDLQNALSAGSVQGVPPIIKRSVVAPYLDGLAFVNALRRRGGWAAVAAAWQRLPASTEQILHLEKFDAREAPELLPPLRAPLSAPSQATYSDVYGEQTLRVLFEEWMPARAARQAASGWAGDRVTAFSNAESTSVAWRIRYDTEAAARLALPAFARGALAPEDQALDSGGRLSEFVSATAAERATQTGQLCRERHSRGPFAVIRRGRELAIVLGPYRRQGAISVSAGACQAALGWAAALFTQPT